MGSRVETPVLVLCGKGFADWSVSPAPEECSGLSTSLPECIYIMHWTIISCLTQTPVIYCVTLLSPCLPQTPVYCGTLSPLLTFEDTRGDGVQWGQSHVLTVSSPKALVSRS